MDVAPNIGESNDSYYSCGWLHCSGFLKKGPMECWNPSESDDFCWKFCKDVNAEGLQMWHQKPIPNKQLVNKFKQCIQFVKNLTLGWRVLLRNWGWRQPLLQPHIELCKHRQQSQQSWLWGLQRGGLEEDQFEIGNLPRRIWDFPLISQIAVTELTGWCWQLKEYKEYIIIIRMW